jgi:hypothetical protein
MDGKSHKDDPLQELARWLVDSRRRIENQVNLSETKRARGTETVVSIDHRFPCSLDAHAGWHIQTQPAFLPNAQFASETRAHIKGAERMRGRGRTIYCHDLDLGEVTSVLGYHIDARPQLPVLITTLGFRSDSAASAAMYERTIAGALVLKHHLHAVAKRIGRGGHVDIDLADKRQLDAADRLGFRKAPQLKRFRPAGTHLRQPAPR